MVLYLDIDGVMVPANSWRRPNLLEDGFPEFSLNAVTALNMLIVELNATIILTTSHKNTYTLKEWKNIFKKRNVLVCEIDRLPKNTNNLNRKEELLQWLNKRRIKENFMIIDDDKSLNGLPTFLKSRLIQTSGSVGLTVELVNEALNSIDKSNYHVV